MFDSLLNQAKSMLGGADPQQVADATRDHVDQTDTGELVQHLTQGAQGMDQGSLSSLGSTLLGSLAQHGHDESQVQDAGVDTAAAAGGDQQNVVALIQHAGENPGALKDAVVTLARQNPQMIAQLPGLVQGILGRLGG